MSPRSPCVTDSQPPSPLAGGERQFQYQPSKLQFEPLVLENDSDRFEEIDNDDGLDYFEQLSATQDEVPTTSTSRALIHAISLSPSSSSLSPLYFPSSSPPCHVSDLCPWPNLPPSRPLLAIPAAELSHPVGGYVSKRPLLPFLLGAARDNIATPQVDDHLRELGMVSAAAYQTRTQAWLPLCHYSRVQHEVLTHDGVSCHCERNNQPCPTRVVTLENTVVVHPRE